MPVDDWFYDWYIAHTTRCPRGDWPDLETPAGAEFYSSLRDHFVDRGLHDLDVATAASKRVFGMGLKFVGDHPRALTDAAAILYAERRAGHVQAPSRRAPTAAEASALSRSAGCPECTRDGNPTGWARRYLKLGGFPRPIAVAWACRCPLGRRRLATDGTDDLQACPGLWDPALSHPSWPDRPVGREPVSGPGWRYLLPGEPVPEPMASGDFAARVFPRRRAEGLGRLPEFVPAPGSGNPSPAPADAS